MRILRRVQFAITIEIYTVVSSAATRAALRKPDLNPPSASRSAALPSWRAEMASYFSCKSRHAGALQKDKDLRQGVRHSPVGSGLVTEHIHGQAG